MRSLLSVSYSNAFQSLTPKEKRWLDIWHNEGAKESAVEALQLCIDLALPASSRPEIGHTTEADQKDILRQWFGFCYGGDHDTGASFKIAIDNNVLTAIEIHKRWKIWGNDPTVRVAADTFLDAAWREINEMTARGTPNGLRPWRRILE